ncbi:ISL3 family transposase [Streptomyces sp. NPDC059828]|uniref:ISL3 family transposase n=1 Tax=Streptomyces sp. NPDC059828 TaxID=3346965 RepID=UPI00365287A7
MRPPVSPGSWPCLSPAPLPCACCGASPAESARPPGGRGRRLRPAPPSPLRHDHHRRRDRGACRCVLPDREAATLEAWLRGKKGVEVVCRDGSATYAEAIRRALPDAVQVSDRWHLWRDLCDRVPAEVRAHAPCWATVNPPRPGGIREQTTRERWHEVHTLLDSGVGLLDCSRRLNLSLNTIKRYARIPERVCRPHRSTLPAHWSTHTASTCADAGPTARPSPSRTSCTRSGSWATPTVPTCWSATSIRAVPKATVPGHPRRFARLLLTHPERLWTKYTDLLGLLTAACPEMTALARLTGEFAALLTPAQANGDKLTQWITTVRTAGPPHLHSFCNGLELDRAAVNAGLTLPHHNGRTEGINTRTKRIMRQMHGRAGFDLLRHRILLPVNATDRHHRLRKSAGRVAGRGAGGRSADAFSADGAAGPGSAVRGNGCCAMPRMRSCARSVKGIGGHGSGHRSDAGRGICGGRRGQRLVPIPGQALVAAGAPGPWVLSGRHGYASIASRTGMGMGAERAQGHDGRRLAAVIGVSPTSQRGLRPDGTTRQRDPRPRDGRRCGPPAQRPRETSSRPFARRTP